MFVISVFEIIVIGDYRSKQWKKYLSFLSQIRTNYIVPKKKTFFISITSRKVPYKV